MLGIESEQGVPLEKLRVSWRIIGNLLQPGPVGGEKFPKPALIVEARLDAGEVCFDGFANHPKLAHLLNEVARLCSSRNPPGYLHEIGHTADRFELLRGA